MRELSIFTLILSTLTLISASGLRQRIVGGNEITYDQSPTMASIQVRGAHFCGGSMLTQRYVLTAAHCTQLFKPSNYSVQIGTEDLSRGGVKIAVLRIVRHKSYDRLLVDYDFAILYLEKVDNFPSNVAFAKLPNYPFDGASVDNQMYVAGWGKTQVKTDNQNLLRQAIVPIVDVVTCRKNYAWATITPRMLCAGYPGGGVDSCEGDSGGPLISVSSGIQVGVTSWGDGCALPDSPGIYARVIYVRDWIYDVAGV